MAVDALSDGVIGLCFDDSLNYLDGNCRIEIEAQYIVNPLLATAIIPDVAMEVTAETYVDSMFTAGSILAEALHIVFQTSGTASKVFAIPRQDAAAAVHALYTMTITGPATSAGYVDLFLGDLKYSAMGVVVNSGDTVATIAAAIVAAIPVNFPYTAAAIATGITFTAKNGGTIGNYLNPVVNPLGLFNYMPSGLTFTTVRTTAGTVNPAPISYVTANGTCCYDAIALLTDDRTWQFGLRDYIKTSWDCAAPQCFGTGYTFNSGTLGQVLATGSNSPELSRVDAPLNDANFPWAITVAYAANSAYRACLNPELSIQGRTAGVLSTIYRPASCSLPRPYVDMVALQDAAFVTYQPLSQGTGGWTHPYIINDVTNSLTDSLGRKNFTWRSVSSRREAKATAVAIATQFQEFVQLGLYTGNTRIAAGVQGTNIRLMTAKMQAYLQSQVGILFSAFDNLDKQFYLKNDFDVAAPCQGVPGNLWAFLQYRPPIRINKIKVSAQPRLLDNCARVATA